MPAQAASVANSAMADELFDVVVAAKDSDPLAPVTVVAPSTYAAVGARRSLALVARGRPRAGVANITSTTLDRLTQQLAGAVLWRQDLRPVSGPIETETVRTVASAGPPSWVRLVTHPRTLAALRGAFAELRRLTPLALEGLARQDVRGADVASLLVAVRSHLHDHGLADPLDVREAALAALSGDTPLPAEVGAVVFLEPPVFAPGEAALVDALGGRTRCLRLVAPPAPVVTERWVCADPEEEARTAVRSVLHDLEGGVALWRQAVLHPASAGYPRLLHQQLTAAALPSNGPEYLRLDGTSAGRALLGLLDLATGDWSRSQVLAWLASAPVRTGPGGRPVPVSRWNAISAAAGVVRGLGQWRDRLGRLAGRDQAEGDEALALADFVQDLAGRVTSGAAGWAARSAWAEGLLEHYLDPEGTALWPDEQRLALTQVSDVVRSLAELRTVSSGVDITGFRAVVRAELERRHLDTAELPGGGVGDGVFVAPFDQARGMRFHTSVLVGMADGLVPGRSTDDALLPDELRAMDASGALRTRSARAEQLLDDVRAGLVAGTGRRIVTSPAVDPRTGREQVPSRFLSVLSAPDGSGPSSGAAAPVRRVDSLVASLRGGGPELSADEHVLRTLDVWTATGADPLVSPPAQYDGRLRTGLEAVQARAGRAFTRFDGLTGSGIVTPFDPTRPVSATRLETYAECPRKFLFGRVLGIRERILPEDLWRIEARDRGSLVHAVLERYVAERIAGAPRSLQRLLDIADEHLDQAAEGGLVGKPLLWRLDRAAIARDLHMFHVEEGELAPLAVELAFGDEDSEVPPVSVELADGRVVSFHGRADRVDRGQEGELVVSDYKTGKQTGIAKLGDDPLDGGRRLQLPLYGMAARQRFGPDDRVMARYWMVSAERAAAFYELELTEALERHFADVVGRIARAVEEGCFPGIPGPPRDTGFEMCMWCDFDRVCPAGRDRQWAAKRGSPSLLPVDDLLATAVAEPLSASLVRVPVRVHFGQEAPA